MSKVVDLNPVVRAKPHAGRFQKGYDPRRKVRERIEVGNTGRTFLELCRDTTEEALNTLLSIMRDMKAPAGDRRAAAMALLDRGWGKPVESMKLEADIRSDGPVDYGEWPTADLMALYMEDRKAKLEQQARTIDGEAEVVPDKPPPWE